MVFTPRPVGPEGVLSSPPCAAAAVSAAVSAASTAARTLLVHQIEFITHTNIQPLPALFFPKVKVIGQKLKVKVKDLKTILLTR